MRFRGVNIVKKCYDVRGWIVISVAGSEYGGSGKGNSPLTGLFRSNQRAVSVQVSVVCLFLCFGFESDVSDISFLEQGFGKCLNVFGCDFI